MRQCVRSAVGDRSTFGARGLTVKVTVKPMHQDENANDDNGLPVQEMIEWE
jgi:hypothetical protein